MNEEALAKLDFPTAEEIEAFGEGEPLGDEDWLIADGELPNEGLPTDGALPEGFAGRPTCPSPTKWKQVGESVRTRGRWAQVSSAVWAKSAPVRHTFRVQRSVTWGTSVEGGMKGTVRLIELELKIRLDTSVTVTTSETLSYEIPKGRIMALYAAPGYLVRRFQRTVYSSAGPCYPVIHRPTVYSPFRSFLVVDFAR